MSTTIAQNLKLQINAVLQQLVTNGFISSVMSADMSKESLTADVPSFPVAIMSMPQVTSTFEDTGNNLRTYRFDILFMMQFDNIVDGDVEACMDQALDAFDTNLTLAGVAQGAMLPAEVIPWPVNDAGKTYSCFIVTIKARALYSVGEVVYTVQFVDGETVAGSGTSWHLSNTPISGSQHLFANGQRLTVANGDYTIDASGDITTALSWPAGALTSDYRIYG